MLSIAQFLQQQRTAYRDTLRGRLARLDALAGQLEDPAQSSGALPALELCAHSVAGSAGTFGFEALGAAARALELTVEEARAHGPDGCLPEVLAGVNALRGHLLAVLAASEPTVEAA